MLLEGNQLRGGAFIGSERVYGSLIERIGEREATTTKRDEPTVLIESDACVR